jgi:mono/diheme cytochrome c family protein
MMIARSWSRRLAVLVGGVAVALGLSACGGSDADFDAGGAASGLDRGAQVYAERCASCHGVDLRGTDKGPSHLSIVYEPNHHPDESFRRAIAIGVPQHHWDFGNMPPVEGLSGADVEAVIAFVRAEQE